MNSAESSRPQPPTHRDLKSPYFILRTPDGLGSYFTAENLPIVASPNEPVSRFLAPARLAENLGARCVRYDLADLSLENARPMEHLPQSEIDAFAQAVRAFYNKAHPEAPRIVPHEKRLRAQFRLPDPDLEPDAYWVHGPAHDRKLLIFWGAELKAATSLLLAPDDSLCIPAGRTILDRLQARVMTWGARQREALRLALDANEPISRYLARRAVDASGAEVGVSCQGRTIETKRLRPLRRLYSGECAAFDRAARAFYDRAKSSDACPYEREIRSAFRLPDPDGASHAYFVAGQRPVIVLDGRESRESTLPLIDHPLVPPAPAAVVPAAGAGEGPVVVSAARPPVGGQTVSAKLRARAISSRRVAALAGAAALALLVGGWATLNWAWDRTPPKVVESADYPAALDARRVAVKFSKAVEPRSIQPKNTAKPSFAFGDDAARIEGAKVDPKDASRVILATTPLVDGKTYHLTVDSIADRAGHRLPDPTSVSFRYLDTVAPELKTISAGDNANQLVLVFTKPVAEATIARGGNYSIFTLEGGGEGAAQRIGSGRLDPEDSTGRTVILDAVRDFVGNQPYRLESIAGVTDASVSRNPVSLPGKGVDFPYRDVLPPRIRAITASVSKLELTVSFSKPVDPAMALNLGNYEAMAPDNSRLSFLPGTAALDTTGRSLTLRFAPARLGLGVYRLTVREMQDRLGNRANGKLSTAFEFADPDRSALKVASHALIAADNHVDNKVTLIFNRALDPEDAVRASNYTLFGADRVPLDLPVIEARRVPSDPAQVLLILAQPPTPGVKIIVHIENLGDIFGDRPDRPIEYAFTPPGIPDPTEQVLSWSGEPTLHGNELDLAIREAVSQPSAVDADNFVFNAPAARVDRVMGYQVATDPKTGARRTLLRLQVRVPDSARRGLTLRARDLRADGLDFLGAQRLRPLAVALN